MDRGFRFNKNSRGFFAYFQLLSQYCVRKIDDVPDGTCFRHVVGFGSHKSTGLVEKANSDPWRCAAAAEFGVESAASSSSPHDYRDFILTRFRLDLLPPLEKPALGMLSRRMKRVLLNEDELIVATRARGLDARLLHLEDMPLYEQVASMKGISILCGMHGSGLMNAMWMRPGAVSVQLLQCKLDEGPYRGSIDVLRGAASHRGVGYFEWKQTDGAKCRQVCV